MSTSTERALREALTELVACKDLQERLPALRADQHSSTNAYRACLAAEIEYSRRKPLAWEAARAALAEHEAGSITAEPVAKVRVHKTGGNAGIAWSAVAVNDFDSLPPMRDGELLYAGTPPTKGPEDVSLSSGPRPQTKEEK